MVDKSKVGAFMLLVLTCLLTSSRHGVQLLNLINQVFAVSSCLKGGPFCLKETAEVRSDSSFVQEQPFSGHVLPSLPVRDLKSSNCSLLVLSLCFFLSLLLATSIH